MNAFKLFSIRGGVHPADRKELTNDGLISTMPVPERLFVPVLQHIGAPADPLVKPGDRVLKGQVLAEARAMVSASVHAPSSGRVTNIMPYVAPHPSGLPGRTIVIETDGLDEAVPAAPAMDWQTASADDLAKRVRESGVVGMGGATFPSAVKLNLRKRSKLHTLLINGSECEPFLTCDDRLMRMSSNAIIEGIQIMMKALEVDKCIIAIEKNKPKATFAMSDAVEALAGIDVVSVPTQYPMGSEKHLVQTLTGQEVPAGGLTADLGIVVHNVATAYAVRNAVLFGKPLIDRLVTVSGSAMNQPQNVWCRIGTPVQDLIDFCGGFKEEPAQLVAGGPMMGQPIRNGDIPIVKGLGGVLALTAEDMKRTQASPCIRCASCVQACPSGLLPLEMAGRIRKDDLEGAVDYGLMDCIACGSCAFVCPASIPLVQYFNYAKGKLTSQQRQKHKQEETKRLAEARAERMERIAAEKKAAMLKKKAAMAAKRKRASS